MTSEVLGAEPQMRRWDEQRWLIDNVIAANGIDFAGPFLGGLVASLNSDGILDAAEVRRRVRKYADIAPASEAVARRREAKAAAALAAGNKVSARENYFLAANFWAFAQWPISETNDLNRFYNQQKRKCYIEYAKLSDHHVEEVWVPFDGKALPGWFHLPPGYKGGRIPAIVSITGMDGFKERGVFLYGDSWLSRGVAVLAIEGPGQYESAVLGIPVTMKNWEMAGPLLASWMLARPEIDPDGLGITGRSFGSLFATIAAANEPRFKACAISAPCLEPGCHTIFQVAPPTFKKRFMWMADYVDEEKFDRFRETITWKGQAEQIKAPFMCVTGAEDELTPLHNTEQMMNAINSPKTLVVYKEARHGIWDVPSTHLGPSPNAIMPDWMLDRFSGKPLQNERLDVNVNGEVVVTKL